MLFTFNILSKYETFLILVSFKENIPYITRIIYSYTSIQYTVMY